MDAPSHLGNFSDSLNNSLPQGIPDKGLMNHNRLCTREVTKIVIIAGEESGDQHAAKLIQTLKLEHPDYQFSGIGGKHMLAAGATLVSDLAQFGVTGLTEVLKHVMVIKKAFNAIKKHLEAEKPDLLILVDYPGFNLRIAKYAKQTLNLKILYYISPQIWAWKANRIKIIQKNIDHMAVILPFEKSLYEKANVPVSFVGHPLVDKVNIIAHTTAQKKVLNLPEDKRIIAVLPGSRRNEIEHHMPVLVEAMRLLSARHKDIHFVIPVAGTLSIDDIRRYNRDIDGVITLVKGQALEVVNCADCVIVASGTASLECALLEKPLCIIYRSSFLTYIAAMKLIHVKYLGLCNLLQNKMIVPELLQYDCNPQELFRFIDHLLSEPQTCARMIARLQKMKRSLSAQSADISLAALVDHLLSI